MPQAVIKNEFFTRYPIGKAMFKGKRFANKGANDVF